LKYSLSLIYLEILFLVLVCKFPLHTIGQDDAVSTAALLHSQYYRLEKRSMSPGW
jgi:hypothetical protein